jgi:hypothetical protein
LHGSVCGLSPVTAIITNAAAAARRDILVVDGPCITFGDDEGGAERGGGSFKNDKVKEVSRALVGRCGVVLGLDYFAMVMVAALNSRACHHK